MKMTAGLVRALRRFLANSALLGAALAGALEMILADPVLPPVDVDRVEVMDADGSRHEITDPGAVARLVCFTREHGGMAVPLRPTASAPPFSDSAMSARFYRGTQLHGWIDQSDRGLLLSMDAYVPLSPGEAAELRRLMRAGGD